MADASSGIVSTESSATERSSVAPVAFSSLPPAHQVPPRSPRLRRVVASVLPVLSFIFAGAVAYASPPPRYQGPPAQPAIAMPDVFVIDLPADSAEPVATAALDQGALANGLPRADTPSVWVYDLPVAGHAARRASAAAHEPPRTISPDQLPVAR